MDVTHRGVWGRRMEKGGQKSKVSRGVRFSLLFLVTDAPGIALRPVARPCASVAGASLPYSVAFMLFWSAGWKMAFPRAGASLLSNGGGGKVA